MEKKNSDHTAPPTSHMHHTSNDRSSMATPISYKPSLQHPSSVVHLGSIPKALPYSHTQTQTHCTGAQVALSPFHGWGEEAAISVPSVQSQLQHSLFFSDVLISLVHIFFCAHDFSTGDYVSIVVWVRCKVQ